MTVVHQTGDADESKVRQAYENLGLSVRVIPFIDAMSNALADADLIIARSGAMTVTEIAMAARAAIFVPYPFHKDMQQLHNARVLERCGGAIIVNDDEDLGRNLAREIERMCTDREELIAMGRRAHLAARPNAARDIAAICFEYADRDGAVA
jgi:UDP-N-acetylglucosamine--N-acetylmuramyl-(pentapeptide) pyrophosphoryl-undecaprenol N-acetylglucosamine transferase